MNETDLLQTIASHLSNIESHTDDIYYAKSELEKIGKQNERIIKLLESIETILAEQS